MASIALLHPLQRDLFLTAKSCFLKGNGKAHPQALSPLGAGAAGGAAAKAAAEEAAEDVPQIAKVEAALETAAETTGACAIAGIHPGKAELVVALALVAVAEDLIGLVDLLESGLGLLVAGVQVRVVLLGQLPVGLLNLCLCGALLDAQDFIVVSFLFCHPHSHPICRGSPPASMSEHSKWGGVLPRPIGMTSRQFAYFFSSSSTTL